MDTRDEPNNALVYSNDVRVLLVEIDALRDLLAGLHVLERGRSKDLLLAQQEYWRSQKIRNERRALQEALRLVLPTRDSSASWNIGRYSGSSGSAPAVGSPATTKKLIAIRENVRRPTGKPRPNRRLDFMVPCACSTDFELIVVIELFNFC